MYLETDQYLKSYCLLVNVHVRFVISEYLGTGKKSLFRYFMWLTLSRFLTTAGSSF